jgi:uncharacterized protein (UPF0248 family)
MRTSHALLLRLRHDPQFDFGRVSVEYLNRGAPGDRSSISGEEILKLEPGWMEVASPAGTTCIPYHRIRRILYEGDTIWELGSR